MNCVGLSRSVLHVITFKTLGSFILLSPTTKSQFREFFYPISIRREEFISWVVAQQQPAGGLLHPGAPLALEPFRGPHALGLLALLALVLLADLGAHVAPVIDGEIPLRRIRGTFT